MAFDFDESGNLLDQQSGGFNFDESGEPISSAPKKGQNKSFKSDLGTALNIGTTVDIPQQVQGLNAFAKNAAPISSALDAITPDFIKNWRDGVEESVRTKLNSRKESLTENYTNESQRSLKKEFFKSDWKKISEDGISGIPSKVADLISSGEFFGDGWSDPRKVFLATAESAPSTIVTMGPVGGGARVVAATTFDRVLTETVASGVERSVAEKVAQEASKKAAEKFAMIAGGASEGAQGAGAAYEETRKHVLDMKKEDLIADENFQKVYAMTDSSLPENKRFEQARIKSAEAAAMTAAAGAGLFDSVFGALGDRYLGSAAANGGVAKNAVRGVVQESPTEFIQSGGEKFSANLGVQRYANSKQNLLEGVGEEATAGGLSGGLLGGAMGGVAGIGSKKISESTTVDEAISAAQDSVNGVDLNQSVDRMLTDAVTAYRNDVVEQPAPTGSFSDHVTNEAFASVGQAAQMGDTAVIDNYLRDTTTDQLVSDLTHADQSTFESVMSRMSPRVQDMVINDLSSALKSAPIESIQQSPGYAAQMEVQRRAEIQTNEAYSQNETAQQQAEKQKAYEESQIVNQTRDQNADMATTISNVNEAPAAPTAMATALEGAKTGLSRQEQIRVEQAKLRQQSQATRDSNRTVAQQLTDNENGLFTPERESQQRTAQAAPTMLAQPNNTQNAQDLSRIVGNARRQADATAQDPQVAEVNFHALSGKTSMPKMVAQTIQQLGKMLGRKIVFVQGDLGADGAVTRSATDNRVFINVDSGINPIAVLGHEMVHRMKIEAPKVYAQLKKTLREGGIITDEMLADFDANYNGTEYEGKTDEEKTAMREAALQKIKKGSEAKNGTNDAEVDAGKQFAEDMLEEMLSDLNGNRFTEPEFWTNVFQKIEEKEGRAAAKMIIQRLREAIVMTINNIMAKLGKSNFDTDQQVIGHLTEVKAALETAFSDYMNEMKGGATEAVGGEGAKFSSEKTQDNNIEFNEETGTLLNQGLLTEQQSLAEKYHSETGFNPYVSERVAVQVETDGAKFSPRRGGSNGQDPRTQLWLNKNGTVNMYLHTTIDDARTIHKQKKITGNKTGRIVLTDESQAFRVIKPGQEKEGLGGVVMVQVKPQLLHHISDNEDGTKTFFIPTHEGESFKSRMQMWSLFKSRKDPVSMEATIDGVQSEIARAMSDWKSADTKTKREMLRNAKALLLREHNVGTLMTENGKLESTRDGEFGLKTEDGRGVDSLGLGLAAAQAISPKWKSTCPQSASCEAVCLGDTAGGNMQYGGVADKDSGFSERSGFRSGPRLSQYLKTEALIQHPYEFAIRMQSEIESLVAWDSKQNRPSRVNKKTGDVTSFSQNGYESAIRLNVTSDLPPKVWKAIMEANKNVRFYDYTKLAGDPIAENHDLTYSSTGASQIVNGEVVVNEHSNWQRMRERLDNGYNVAMAFSHTNHLPEFLFDEETGKTYRVWNGDNYDARYRDPKQDDGIGMIIGLKKKDATMRDADAAAKSNGFFLNYDPSVTGKGSAVTVIGDTVTMPDQSQFKDIVAGRKAEERARRNAFKGISVKTESPSRSQGEASKTVSTSAGSSTRADSNVDLANEDVKLSNSRIDPTNDGAKDGFWNKLSGRDGFTAEQFANALAGDMRTDGRGTAGFSGLLRSGTPVVAWDREVAGFDGYVTAGIPLKDGSFNMVVIPSEFVVGGRIPANEIHDKSILAYTLFRNSNGMLEIAVTEAEKGTRAFSAMESRGVIEKTKNKDKSGRPYYRVDVGAEESKKLLREAIRRYAIENGGIEDIQVPKRDTGANPTRPRLFAKETIEAKFSTSRKQTETAEFKKWFGDSKVVDAEGRPLVLYRGQPSNYNGANLLDRYFTADREYASEYGDPYADHDTGANVVPVYVVMNKPYFADVDYVTDWSFERDRDSLIAKGYDGIASNDKSVWVPFDTTKKTADLWKNDYDDSEVSSSALATDQPSSEAGLKKSEMGRIKSAIGNNGQFDGENPGIRFSPAIRAINKLSDPAEYSYALEAFIDFYGYADRAESELSNYSSVVNSLIKNGGEVFRLVFADSKSDIRLDNTGSHWTVEEYAISYYADKFSRMYAKGKNPFVLVATVKPGVVTNEYVDISGNPEELEVNLTADPESIKVYEYDIGRGVTTGEVKFSPPRFYSQLERAVEQAPAKVFGPAKQVSTWLQANKSKLGITITDSMREKVGQGMPLFSPKRIVGSSKRQYTAAQKQMFANTGREIEEKTRIERVTEFLKNDFFKKMATGIVDQFRGLRDLNDGGQAYMLARLSKGTAGAFDALLHHGKLSIRGGAYDGDTTGGFVERLGVPLNGELDDLLWWIAANRADKLKGQGKENLFSPQDIAAGKSLASGTTDWDYTIQTGPARGQVTRDRLKIFADAQRVFNEFQKNTLDMAEQSGLIDGNSRQYWESEFYVPFYRVSEEDGEFIGNKMGNALVRQQAFKKLKGGTDKLNSDLLSNTLLNWSHLIEASAKNRAAKAALTAAENAGVAHQALPGEKKTVWYMDNGQKVEYKVDDPFVMTAITSLEYAGMRNPIMDALSTFKHWLTIGVTASPAFKVRNLIRDSVQAIGTSGLGYNPIKNVVDGFKQTGRDRQEYVSALASGGLIRFGTMLEGSESKRVRQLIRSGVKDSSILNDEGKWQAFYDKFLEPGITAYNELGNRSEEINRAALYNQLIAQGVSHAEAALMARDLMDFSMQGSFNTIRFLSQVVPFLNARLQGMYKLGRSAKDNPRKMAIVTGAVAMASISLMLAYGDDDDWKRREDWDRDNFWWFKFAGIEFRIPKPFEIGAVATLAERSLEYMIDDEMTGERFRKVTYDLVKNNLSMNPVPQMVKPIIDLYANKDSFSGRPIESMSMQRLDPTMRYNSGTSLPARGLSQAIGGAMSPVQIDHVVRGYFGWLGSFVVGGADMAARAVSNEPEKPTMDYWKFATQGILKEQGTGGSRYLTMVYEQAKELEEAHATFNQLRKDGKIEEAKEYSEDNADKLRRYKQVESVKKAESKLSERIRMIERSNIDPDEKRGLIDAIQKQKEQVAKRIAPGLN